MSLKIMHLYGTVKLLQGVATRQQKISTNSDLTFLFKKWFTNNIFQSEKETHMLNAHKW